MVVINGDGGGMRQWEWGQRGSGKDDSDGG